MENVLDFLKTGIEDAKLLGDTLSQSLGQSLSELTSTQALAAQMKATFSGAFDFSSIGGISELNTSLGDLFTIGSEGFAGLQNSVGNIGNSLSSIFDLSSVTDFSSAVDFVGESIGNVQNIMGEFANVQNLLNTGTQAYQAIVSGVSAVQEIWKNSTQLVSAAQQGLNAAFNANPIGFVVAVVMMLVQAFMTLWNNCEGFRNFFLGLWEKLKEIGAWIGNTFAEIWGKIGDVIKNVWEGVKNAFVSVLNIIIGGINKFLSFILSPINLVIKGLNLIPGVDIPELKVEIPKISPMASGGIVSGPTLAYVGEYAGARNNPEVVAPLSKLRGMLESDSQANVVSVLYEIADRLENAIDRSGSIYLDGAELGRQLLNPIEREQRRRGSRVLAL